MSENTRSIVWASHSKPSKVGKTEKVSEGEARVAVRTGQARYADAPEKAAAPKKTAAPDAKK